jgi:hypothetical protein
MKLCVIITARVSNRAEQWNVLFVPPKHCPITVDSRPCGIDTEKRNWNWSLTVSFPWIALRPASYATDSVSPAIGMGAVVSVRRTKFEEGFLGRQMISGNSYSGVAGNLERLTFTWRYSPTLFFNVMLKKNMQFSKSQTFRLAGLKPLINEKYSQHSQSQNEDDSIIIQGKVMSDRIHRFDIATTQHSCRSAFLLGAVK